MRLLSLALVAAIALTGAAQARDVIHLTGSSTVLPFATIVAEAFGQNTNFKTPVVEGGGTGAGIAKFCEGVGEGSVDIANASRKMKSGEANTCRKNGVTEVLELRFGYDGIVFASAAQGPAFAFTPSMLFKAMAAEVDVGGQLVPNPYTTWNQIDPALPAQEILLYIPGSKHGTREVFDTKVTTKGCTVFKTDKLFKKRDGKADACLTYRNDGRVVEIDGDYTETLSRLKANPQAIGVFGLSFYENNTDKLQVASYMGVVPSKSTISSGKYFISRPLFIYIKTQNYSVVPGLKEFAQFFVSNEIAGAGGPLESYGLVVDPKLSSAQAKTN
ncbi:substrate-binding domain-containing protein [Rhodobacter sp. KR11]|jgi:phosphate transport system substrate-binding protein|uniref:substrate-binding domain-containing protein n=1 Tax=Rhodobacter sp. KR11 TaxID=2974588 RepID=UPI002221D030|nr:substrate-binding domain-containing protein [Rhodobacter sp. KR11]MCW1917226.1 substrate-binding domain-containing protein [Rhodobacter sp. KR11]